MRKNATPELAVGVITEPATETVVSEPSWDDIPDPVIVVDADGMVCATSTAALAIFPAAHPGTALLDCTPG